MSKSFANLIDTISADVNKFKAKDIQNYTEDLEDPRIKTIDSFLVILSKFFIGVLGESSIDSNASDKLGE